MTELILITVGVLLAVAAGASVFRIVRGPSILDRMIASDMLVTTLILVLGAEMVVHEHTRTIPIMIVLSLTAVFASMSVARYVSKQGGGKPTVPTKPGKPTAPTKRGSPTVPLRSAKARGKGASR